MIPKIQRTSSFGAGAFRAVAAGEEPWQETLRLCPAFSNVEAGEQPDMSAAFRWCRETGREATLARVMEEFPSAPLEIPIGDDGDRHFAQALKIPYRVTCQLPEDQSILLAELARGSITDLGVDLPRRYKLEQMLELAEGIAQCRSLQTFFSRGLLLARPEMSRILVDALVRTLSPLQKLDLTTVVLEDPEICKKLLERPGLQGIEAIGPFGRLLLESLKSVTTDVTSMRVKLSDFISLTDIRQPNLFLEIDCLHLVPTPEHDSHVPFHRAAAQADRMRAELLDSIDHERLALRDARFTMRDRPLPFSVDVSAAIQRRGPAGAIEEERTRLAMYGFGLGQTGSPAVVREGLAEVFKNELPQWLDAADVDHVAMTRQDTYTGTGEAPAEGAKRWIDRQRHRGMPEAHIEARVRSEFGNALPADVLAHLQVRGNL